MLVFLLVLNAAYADTGWGGGDTGSPMDTSDTGDSSDSGDTAETGDTAECGSDEANLSLDAGGEPKLPDFTFMGTGISATASWSLSSEASVNSDECQVDIAAEGQLELCGSVMGQRTCISGEASAEPSCTAPATCEDGAQSCDLSDVCCEGPASLGISGSREWDLSGHPIGPVTFEATVTGDVTLAYDGDGSYGPGCECPGLSLGGTASATLSAKGSGTARASLFGIEAATAEAQVEACATVEKDMTSACGESDSSEARTGVGLVVHAEAQSMGWLNLGSYSKTYKEGVDCLGGEGDE